MVFVVEAVGVEREVFWDGDVGEFGPVNDVVWGSFYGHLLGKWDYPMRKKTWFILS